jgi:hypothetical protein
MKVTGYDLRNALTRLNNRKSLLQNLWNESLYAFEGEERDPVELANNLLTLRTGSSIFNSLQTTTSLGCPMLFPQ